MLSLALGGGACSAEPIAPAGMTPHETAPSLQQVDGTGFAIESLTGLELLGTSLGDLVIEEAVVKEFGPVEDVLGNIVGLRAEGLITLTGDALGVAGATEEFTATVGIVNRGRGQCDVITFDPAPLTIDVGGTAVSIEVPQGETNVRGSGAVGNLLCGVGRLLTPVTSGAARAIQSLVDAINRILI